MSALSFHDTYDKISTIMDGQELHMVMPVLAYLLAECTLSLTDGDEDMSAVKMTTAMYLDAYKRLFDEVPQQNTPQGVTLN